MALGVFVWAWMARYLGPTQFGLYNYALAVVGLFGVIAALGLDGVVVREIVHNPGSRHEILGTAFNLKLIGGLLALLLAVLSITLLRAGDTVILWLVGIIAAALVLKAFSVIDLWFQSQVESKFSVYVRSMAFIFTVIVIITLIINHAPLIAFASVNFIEAVLVALGLIVLYRVRGHHLATWKARTVRAKALLRDSWPLVLSGLAIAVYMHTDQIMLGEMVDDRAVGIYSAATRLSNVWYFIPVAILSSVYPSFLQAKQSNEDLYRNLLQKIFNLLSLLAYIIAILVSLASFWLVAILFGDKYIDAAPILAIHVWAGLFVFFGVAREKWMITEGLTKFSFATTALGAGSNVLLNYCLIPIYGAVGAAISTLVSYSVAVLLSCTFYKRTRPIAFVMLKALVFGR